MNSIPTVPAGHTWHLMQGMLILYKIASIDDRLQKGCDACIAGIALGQQIMCAWEVQRWWAGFSPITQPRMHGERLGVGTDSKVVRESSAA